METTIKGLGFRGLVSLKQIDYGVYGDLIIISPKAIFYLLKGDYSPTVGFPKGCHR